MIKFSSDKTEPIFMFEANAKVLFNMMNIPNHVPSAITDSELLSKAIEKLKEQLNSLEQWLILKEKIKNFYSKDLPINLTQDKPNNTDDVQQQLKNTIEQYQPLIDLFNRYKVSDELIRRSAVILLMMLEKIKEKNGFIQWEND